MSNFKSMKKFVLKSPCVRMLSEFSCFVSQWVSLQDNNANPDPLLHAAAYSSLQIIFSNIHNTVDRVVYSKWKDWAEYS